MSAFGKKLRRTTDGYAHWCPACEEVHVYRTDNPAADRPRWSFNGDVERPSFTPSMRISWGDYASGHEYHKANDGKPRGGICHYFIKTGQELAAAQPGRPGIDPSKSYIDYCGDSTHAMAGKTVDLPDWPYPKGAYGGIEE